MHQSADPVTQDQGRNVLLGTVLLGDCAALTATVIAIAMGQHLGVVVLAYLGPLGLALILAVILNLSRASDKRGNLSSQCTANSQKGNI